MKVIIKNGKRVSTSISNGQERREYNRKFHTNYTKEEFDVIVALARLQAGIDADTLAEMQKRGMVHFDNEELVPNGTEVMLNYEEIMSRNKNDLTEDYLNWVEDNKETVFHLSREENEQKLVCMEEDSRIKEIDGNVVQCPKWLFDLYYDIMVKYNGEWIPVWDYENKLSEIKEEEKNA